MFARLTAIAARLWPARPDLLLHAFAGALVALVVLLLTGSGALALAATIVVGVGKELYDSAHPERHHVDPLDTVATAVPGLVVWLLVGPWPSVAPMWVVG